MAKTAATKTEAPKTAKTAATPKEPSKAENARKLFAKMAGKPRKDVIGAFQEKLGLSPAASATYYQNCKKASEAPTA